MTFQKKSERFETYLLQDILDMYNYLYYNYY